ncbi:MAG: copper resistance protein CopC [Jatrophihabitantaceae bacterium]
MRDVRRLLAVAAAAATIALSMLVLAQPAAAHAIMQSSTPSDGQLIARADRPATVELRFDEAVSIRTGSIQVLAADGHRVDLASASHPAGEGRRVAVGIRTGLADGSYLVLWQVVSADSHPIAGSFTFSVGHPGAIANASAAHGSRLVAVALAGSRMLSYLGVFGLVGGLGFVLLCWPAGAADRRARRLLAGSWIAAAAAVLVSLGLQAADDIGGGLSSAIDPTALTALLGTQYGRAHLIRLALLAGFAVAAARWTPPPMPAPRGPARGLIGLGLLAVLGTIAAEGHAGAGGLSTLRMVDDVAHLAAAGLWLGGLAMLATAALPAARRSTSARLVPAAVLVSSGISSSAGLPPTNAQPGPNPAGTADLALTLRRFSAIALSCVGVIVASGLLQAWPQVHELAALPATNYGRLLLAKVGVFALVIAAAIVSRSAIHSRLARTGPKLSALSASVLIELGLAVLVLAITSALVATTPARIAYRPTEAVTVRAGPDTVQLSAVPVGEHLLELHIYVFGANGLPVEVPRLRVVAEPPAGSLGPVDVALLAAGTGHFVGNRVLLPRTGQWTLRLAVQETEFDEFGASATVTVR